jgi:hypothetical protein
LEEDALAGGVAVGEDLFEEADGVEDVDDVHFLVVSILRVLDQLISLFIASAEPAELPKRTYIPPMHQHCCVLYLIVKRCPVPPKITHNMQNIRHFQRLSVIFDILLHLVIVLFFLRVDKRIALLSLQNR